MALSRYCLDTSTYSNFKRGEPRAVELIDTATWLGLPAVVIGELWLGFILGRRRDRNMAEFEDFLSNPIVHEIVLDRFVGRIYAEILASLREAGTPLPSNDIWIAAAAASVGAPVLTYDAHFTSIQRIGTVVLGTT